MAKPGLREVIERHRERLLKIEGIHGVGTGESLDDPAEPCIFVYTDLDEWPADLPRELDGYPVRLQHASRFKT